MDTSFKFHSNLLFKSNKSKFFPSFYREIILNWKIHLAMTAEIPSCILSQYRWCNKSIHVDKAYVSFLKFPEKVKMVSLKNGMNLRESTTSMKVHNLNSHN